MAASQPVEQLTPFGHALAGALGGVFSNAAVYPLDTVKTRIQADTSFTKDEKGKGKGPKSAKLSIVKLLLKIMQEEGPGGFYKGFGASMVSVFSQQYAYFFFYSFVRNSYLKRLARLKKAGVAPVISTAMELILGAVAAALAQIFTIPISVIATRQQIGRSKKVQNKLGYSAQPYEANRRQDDDGNDSFLAVARRIIREDGVGGLWLGIKPGLVLTVNPAITYGVFERVKSITLRGNSDTKLSPARSFMVGALSKTLATIVTYPYIMAKVRVQASIKEEDDSDLNSLEEGSTRSQNRAKYSGSLDVLKKVWSEEGFFGWYQGMGAQILKAVLTQALLFVSKDQFEKYALIILRFWRRFTS